MFVKGLSRPSRKHKLKPPIWDLPQLCFDKAIYLVMVTIGGSTDLLFPIFWYNLDDNYFGRLLTQFSTNLQAKYYFANSRFRSIRFRTQWETNCEILIILIFRPRWNEFGVREIRKTKN